MADVVSFTVYGLVAAAEFQRCVEAAAYVNKKYPESFVISVVQELPREFLERRDAWAMAGLIPSLQPDAIPADSGPSNSAGEARCEHLVLVEEHGSGGAPQRLLTAPSFLQLMSTKTSYRGAEVSDDYYVAQGQKAWRSFLASRNCQYCWMNVSLDGQPIGTIWFELYASVAPLTCKNFCELCRGTTVAKSTPNGRENGSLGPAAAQPQQLEASYKGTTFFRILKDAWVIGGDVTEGHTGNGGYSCFGRCFPDETFAVSHDAAGILGMCNDGPHTNSSAFYITRRCMSWMNGKYVAFGRVMDGMDVVHTIHSVEVRHNQSPKSSIVITDCGVLDTEE